MLDKIFYCAMNRISKQQFYENDILSLWMYRKMKNIIELYLHIFIMPRCGHVTVWTIDYI